MAEISPTYLTLNHWSQNGEGVWFYRPTSYPSSTHLMLRVGDSTLTLNCSINGMPPVNIYLAGTGFSLSFADAIHDKMLAATFARAVGILNQGLMP